VEINVDAPADGEPCKSHLRGVLRKGRGVPREIAVGRGCGALTADEQPAALGVAHEATGDRTGAVPGKAAIAQRQSGSGRRSKQHNPQPAAERLAAGGSLGYVPGECGAAN